VTRTTLVLPRWMAEEIAGAARDKNEAGAVLLAGVAHASTGLRLLGRELHWVPEDAYDRRTPFALSILSAGYVDALARADEIGAVPIWLHTHPGEDAIPRPSEHDIAVDDELRETFRVRTCGDTYASVIFSPSAHWFKFSGQVDDGAVKLTIERLLIVGDRWALLEPVDSPEETALPTAFDRQIRAFGGEVQRVLAALTVGVVGSGGTGSAVSEQLVRLGIGRILLIDPDRLSESNVTRVYGSTQADVGRTKVSVLGDYLHRIAPAAVIGTVEGTVTDERVARNLTSCDVVFGCTDDNAGRLVLSRLASYYLVPLIDCGVLLSSENGVLQGIDGRITVVTPGNACLVCRRRVDMARAQAEQLDPAERAARQAEGYAPELGGVEPAVVPYTTAVASFAVGELLERLIGYGPDTEPGELLLRLHDREISTNTRTPIPRHYCNPETGVLGVGDATPFLGQTWRTA
jgi:molybdopterin/thiamine biosynthesis adenylyltransferase